MKKVYPAIFETESNGLVSVTFPDLPDCYSSGEDMADAISNAEDALSYRLDEREEENVEAPVASDIKSIQCGENQIVTLICGDAVQYQKLYGKKSVNRMVCLPAYLDTAASKKGISLSPFLQRKLKDELGIE